MFFWCKSWSYGTDTRIFSILIGSALYFIFKDKKLNSKKVNILSYIFLGIIIFITLSVDYSSKSNYYGFLYLISILGGFITVTSLKTGFLDFDGPMAKPLSKLGEVPRYWKGIQFREKWE